MSDIKTESPQDFSKERPLHEEANAIKQGVTQALAKDKMPGTNEIEFTALGSIIIDGLNPNKIKPSLIHNYVPDHFFIGHLIVRMFEFLRNEKVVKKNEDLDPFGLLLYIYYGTMYHILRCLNNLGVTDPEAQFAQTLFENVGYTTALLPSFLNSWIDGIGTYVDDVFGKKFEPRLPPIEITLDDHNQGFWSKNTAHLLPNFNAILRKLVFFSDEPRAKVKVTDKNITSYRDQNQEFTILNGFNDVRTYDRRIPGIGFLERRHVSSELARLAYDAFSQRFTNAYARYFSYSPELLSYLLVHYRDLVGRMDHFSITKVSPTGNDLIVCILRESIEQDVIQGEQRSQPPSPKKAKNSGEEEESDPPKISRASIFAHNSKIFTKSRKVNGLSIIASVSPITRISVEENQIPFEDYDFQSPYHAWFDDGYEFSTIEFTLDEAHAKFVKQKSKIA